MSHASIFRCLFWHGSTCKLHSKEVLPVVRVTERASEVEIFSEYPFNLSSREKTLEKFVFLDK